MTQTLTQTLTQSRAQSRAQSLTKSLVQPVLGRAETAVDNPDAAGDLARQLGPGPFALVIVFVAPCADVERVVAAIQARFAPTPVIGCTTAGEIGRDGYAEGLIVATALPARDFAAQTLLVGDLDALNSGSLVREITRHRGTLAQARPDWGSDFAFLMVDGLSTREDAVTSAIAPALGATPLFGGSAGDGTRFLRTFVFHDGAVLRNAAVLALVRTRCPIRVFKFDHFRPTETRMVVTQADPSRRIVQMINAEPAAREYARLLGKDPGQLTTFTFAAHPVVVRLGGQHHVRSIRQVDENGDLIFHSAIDEGLVLTLAEPLDMHDHLASEFAALASTGAPSAILACDCILRRMEAQEKQLTGRISALLRENRVTGFSTYGEQLNAMHVNQTLTGVAFYPPPAA